MGHDRRSLVLAGLAAFALSGGPLAAREQSAFEQSLEDGDFRGAALQIDRINEQRRPGRSDPRLDALYGRFLAAAAQGRTAEPYLLRAIAATKDPVERDALWFELARAREVDGYVGKAENDYRQLSSRDRDPDIAQQAILSLARLHLPSNPEEAAGLLAPLAAGGVTPSLRWEADLLLSRAHALAGRSEDSRKALDNAWVLAPATRFPAHSIALTAMDMAVDRAAGGDRRAAISLLSTGSGSIRFAGGGQLPICGATVRPEDSVTIAIASDEKRRPIFSLVRASRPGIAESFMRALAASPQRIDKDAIYATLRCRTAPDANMRFIGGAMTSLMDWMAGKGYYPLLAPINPGEGDMLAQLKDRVLRQERLDGVNSAALVPALIQLAVVQLAQGRFGAAASLIEAKASIERAQQRLMSAGAPIEVVEQIKIQTTLLFAQNDNVADVAGPAAGSALSGVIARPETTTEQAFATFSNLSRLQQRPADKINLADMLLRFFDSRKVAADAPIRQATELARASTLRDVGTVAGLKERLESHGIAGDLCPAADREPSIPPTAITLTSEDYPKDALRYSLMGLTTMELAISPTGKIENQRIIVSQPGGVFDTIATDKLRAVTLFPAQRNNSAIGCRGYVQRVRWQVPADSGNIFETLSGALDPAE